MRRQFLILLFVMVAARSLAEAQVLLSIRDTTLTRGSTALIPVMVDSSLTGLAVSSYQIDIRFSSGVIDVDSAISAGSMTQSWGVPTFNVSPGRIVVAGAASDTLSGTGILVYLKVSLPLSSTSTYTSLQFASALLNQGVPATVTRNGNLFILNLPSITVIPDGALLTVGETTQFSAVGGTAPYSWSTTNPKVASITSSGLLTGISAGTCRVVAQDTNSLLDTSGQVEIRAFKLMLRDTSILQGQTFLLPVYCTDLGQVDVFSGQFSVSYNQNILTALGTDENGALLQQYGSSTVGLTPGRITVSFAGSSPLIGVGVQVLVYLRFAVSDTNAGGTSLNISNLVFNQDVLGNIRNAYFTALTRAALSVNPSSGTLMAGDSLQFNVIGTPVLPLTWSITDTSIATISNTGLLRAIRSGVLRVSVVDSVGASGSSGNISIYDMRVSVRDTSATPGDTVDVGIEVGSFAPGMSSVQLRVSFNQTYLNAIGVATTGTLSNGWATSFSSPSPGVFSLAAAGANTVTGPGTLLNIRFTIADSAYQAAFPVTLSNVLFNEGNPLGLPVNGQIFVFVTAPSAPFLSSPPDGALNQPTTLTLSWGAPAGARRYRLQVSTDSLFGTTVFDDSTIAAPSRLVGPLANSTRYFWRVNARNSAGTSPYSQVRNFTTGAGAPAAPTLASPPNGATNQPVTLTLAWNASAGATTYRLQVSTDSLFGTSVFDDSTIAGTSRQVGPLANSTTYYWRVNAKNVSGASPFSQVWNFTTAGAGAPAAPTLVSPPNGATNQPTTLTLTWNASAGAVTYRLQVSVDSLFGTTPFDDSTITGTSQQVGPVLNSTTYYWRVNAKNSSGTSPFSQVRNFTTIVATPTAPTLASPPNGATNQPTTLTLTWNASAGATTYRLQVSTDSLFGTTTFNDSTVTGTSQQVGPLANSTTYYWRVNAKNVSGTSPYSQVWNFTTAAIGAFFVIYSGDANNDGIADVRDILPIGLYYNRTGPARQNPSLLWSPPDTLRQAWNPVQACYADCDGNGVVEAADVVPLVQNWYSTHSGGPVAGVNRRQVCEELLRGIDGQPSSPAMREIRNVIVGYMKTQLGIVFEYTLEQNWPNPFNPSTVIRFSIPEAQSAVGLSIYNTLGQLVWEQRLTDLQPGKHEVTWSGESTTGLTAASGIYLYRLSAGSYTSVRRMILLK